MTEKVGLGAEVVLDERPVNAASVSSRPTAGGMKFVRATPASSTVPVAPKTGSPAISTWNGRPGVKSLPMMLTRAFALCR